MSRGSTRKPRSTVLRKLMCCSGTKRSQYWRSTTLSLQRVRHELRRICYKYGAILCRKILPSTLDEQGNYLLCPSSTLLVAGRVILSSWKMRSLRVGGTGNGLISRQYMQTCTGHSMPQIALPKLLQLRMSQSFHFAIAVTGLGLVLAFWCFVSLSPCPSVGV